MVENNIPSIFLLVKNESMHVVNKAMMLAEVEINPTIPPATAEIRSGIRDLQT